MLPRIANKPYQAEFERSSTQRLGVRTSTVRSQGIVARDSNGLELEEEHVPEESGEETILARLHDPIKGRFSILDRRSKTVLMVSAVSAGAGLIIDVGDTAIALPIGRIPEGGDLIGSQLIEGLSCTGRRHTTPSGSLEVWIADELEAVVLILVLTNNRESSFRLHNIRLKEPDAALFSVP